MEVAVPAWLNNSFIIQILQSIEQTKQGLQVVQWRPAATSGGNTSHLFSISVDYKYLLADAVHSTYFIVKVPLLSGNLGDIIRKENLCNKEKIFYKEVMPRFNKLQNLELTPKSYFCPLDSCLVLEDLRARAYETKDRMNLDLTHSQHLFFTLARFHALSVEVFHKEPQLAAFVSTHFLFNDRGAKEDQGTKRNLSARLLRGVANTVEKLDGCQRYATLIRERIGTYWENMVKILNPRGGLTILNHGDPWTNNVLFKYDATGAVIDVKLIDFQMYHFSSFAFDILFFWWISASDEVREHHREELFEYYRQTLNTTLYELMCDVTLSKEDFDLEIKTCASYSLYVIAFKLAFKMADLEKVFDTTNFDHDDFSTKGFDDDAPSSKQSAIEECRVKLPTVLRQLEQMGSFL